MWGEWRCGSASYTRGEGASGGVAEEGVAADALAVRGALLARAVHRAQLRARNTVRVECGCDIPCCYCHLDELGGGRGAALGPLSASAFCFGIHHDIYFQIGFRKIELSKLRLFLPMLLHAARMGAGRGHFSTALRSASTVSPHVFEGGRGRAHRKRGGLNSLPPVRTWDTRVYTTP